MASYVSIISLVIGFATLLGIGYLFKGMWIDPFLEFRKRKQKLIGVLISNRLYFYSLSSKKDDVQRVKMRIHEDLRKEASYFGSVANLFSLKFWYFISCHRRSFEKDMHNLKKILNHFSNSMVSNKKLSPDEHLRFIEEGMKDLEEILKFKFEYKDK